MTRALLLSLPLALAACATTPTPPEVRTVEVQIPVPVHCVVQPVTKPAFAVDALPLGSKAPAQMRALRAERKQRIGYEAELEAALLRCMKP
ncbi:hypothetical protein [Geminicoccus flavidas]|uniref:hypothetical protein n=1 Tax=Geminicoccus flavidas TaxID=2506407 RepID=UPI00135C4BF4|nr:hypothetical protein [Geminicoccus flavidas]